MAGEFRNLSHLKEEAAKSVETEDYLKTNIYSKMSKGNRPSLLTVMKRRTSAIKRRASLLLNMPIANSKIIPEIEDTSEMKYGDESNYEKACEVHLPENLFDVVENLVFKYLENKYNKSFKASSHFKDFVDFMYIGQKGVAMKDFHLFRILGR